MKSNNNLKNTIKNTISLLLYIFLILSVEVESTYKTISLSKYRNRALKNSAKNQVKTPFNNPLANLLAGIKLIFMPSDNEDNFYSCFPKSWRSTASSEKEKNGFFNKLTSFIQFLGKKIIAFFPSGPIMDFICENRATVINKIKSFLPLRKRREISEKFYGKLNKRNKYVRKFRMTEQWLDYISSTIMSAAKTVYNTGKSLVQKGVSFIKEQVMNIFTKAKNFIVTVVKSLVSFFKDVLFTFVSCFVKNPTLFVGTAFAFIAGKLKSKFTKFQLALTTGVVLFYLANEFLGYLCMKNENEFTNKTLLEAFAAKNDNTKALLMGEGLANMVKTFANAQ